MFKILNFQDKTTTETRENTPNSAESTTKRVELVIKIHANLKKQSQFPERVRVAEAHRHKVDKISHNRRSLCLSAFVPVNLAKLCSFVII